MALLTREDLAEIDLQYGNIGAQLREVLAEDRRLYIATMVAALGRTCPVAVADVAACAELRVVLGGAR